VVSLVPFPTSWWVPLVLIVMYAVWRSDTAPSGFQPISTASQLGRAVRRNVCRNEKRGWRRRERSPSVISLILHGAIRKMTASEMKTQCGVSLFPKQASDYYLRRARAIVRPGQKPKGGSEPQLSCPSCIWSIVMLNQSSIHLENRSISSLAKRTTKTVLFVLV
jgi:hypothetical protein